MKARRWRINKNCKWTAFSELAECLARISPKITLYGLLFKYNYVGWLLPLMFSSDLLFAIKRDAYIFKETGWFCRFPKHQKLEEQAMAGEKRQTCWPKPHTETEYESQITTILYWIKLIPSLWSELLGVRWQSLAKISWFLCHCEILTQDNFIKIRSCGVWILWLAICLVSFRALSQSSW